MWQNPKTQILIKINFWKKAMVKDKICFCLLWIKKWVKRNLLKNVYYCYFGQTLGFYNINVSFDYIELDLILQLSSLTLGFACRLGVHYTLNTLYWREKKCSDKLDFIFNHLLLLGVDVKFSLHTLYYTHLLNSTI